MYVVYRLSFPFPLQIALWIYLWAACYYTKLQHTLYEDTGQAVSSINSIIDFRVWFSINFIFPISLKTKITEPYGAS